VSRLESQEQYDAWHARLEEDSESNAPWHRLARRSIDPIRDLKDRTIIEIACGRGGFAVALATGDERPRMVVGADFSTVALKKAAALSSRLGAPNITWEQQDILAITHPAASFDTVFSFETIEHVVDPAGAIRELARILRPGGRLFLTTPNYLGTLGLYRIYLWLSGREFSELGQPINQVTTIPRTLYWLAAAGLRTVRIRCEGQYLPFPRRPPVHLRRLEQFWPLKPLGLHSFFLAEKPSNGFVDSDA